MVNVRLLFVELSHGFPSLDDGDRVIEVSNLLSVLLGGRHEVLVWVGAGSLLES